MRLLSGAVRSIIKNTYRKIAMTEQTVDSIIESLNPASRIERVCEQLGQVLVGLKGEAFKSGVRRAHLGLSQPSSPFSQPVPFRAGSHDIGMEEKSALVKAVMEQEGSSQAQREVMIETLSRVGAPSEAMISHQKRWEQFKASSGRAMVAKINHLSHEASRADPIGYARLCDSGADFGKEYAEQLGHLTRPHVSLIKRPPGR
jgi:hypothetical protein